MVLTFIMLYQMHQMAKKSFFVDAIDHEKACGTQILLEGDTVVMDDCGFHQLSHSRTVE